MRTVPLSVMLGIVASLALHTISTCQPDGLAGLKPGDKAPDFKLTASDGKEYTLAQFRGVKAVAICWYPHAGSNGTKTQFAALEANMARVPSDKVQIFGCGTAPLSVTATFAQQGKYSFPLLSDPDGNATRAYGCLQDSGAARRWTYLIDDKGAILAVNRNITPQTQGSDLMRMLADAGMVPLATSAVQGNAPPAPAQGAPATSPTVVTVGPVRYTTSAAVQITPTVTSSVVTMSDHQYTVYSYSREVGKSLTVVIPEGLKTVRGLLVNANCAGGDSRGEWAICEYYRQFMHLHGFAYVGSAGTPGNPTVAVTPRERHALIFQTFLHAVQQISIASKHPELPNAPYAGVGFSAGGGFAFDLMAMAPDKTIAAASYASPYIFKRRITPPPSAALLNVPSVCITGEREGSNVPGPTTDPSIGKATIDEVFVPYRPKGAEYAWLERQGIGHQYDKNRQDVLGMPLLDAAVRARYPADGDVTKGPIKLIDIDPSTGWIADNTTWKSGLTKICPATEFRGDLGHSSWLQNEDIAFIYRAYSTYDKPLAIISPDNCWPTKPSLGPGATVPITVDAGGFPDWKTMAFYDGAKTLGEITQGVPPQFTATKLTPGYHVFSVLATDANGTVRTADPKMVVVRNLPAQG